MLVLLYLLGGAGPSLWALALPGAQGALACDRAACRCSLDEAGRPNGKACCCRMQAQLLKKFPELRAEAPACSISAQPCGASPETLALQPARPHLRAVAPPLFLGEGFSQLRLTRWARPCAVLRLPPEAVPKG